MRSDTEPSPGLHLHFHNNLAGMIIYWITAASSHILLPVFPPGAHPPGLIPFTHLPYVRPVRFYVILLNGELSKWLLRFPPPSTPFFVTAGPTQRIEGRIQARLMLSWKRQHHVFPYISNSGAPGEMIKKNNKILLSLNVIDAPPGWVAAGGECGGWGTG